MIVPPERLDAGVEDPDSIVEKIARLSRRLAGRFPSPASRGLRYEAAGNTEWTPGFWTGLLWLAYRHGGDRVHRETAEGLLPSFADRLEQGGPGVETHDLGFLYTLSCKAAHSLTGDPAAKRLALQAADVLSGRYLAGGRVIQAWGSLDDPRERGRIIIDTAMNLPLLFWAAEQTGDGRYRSIAFRHLHQAARLLVREDGSTFHTCFVDPATGQGRCARTHQGFSDDSCWSRGQAWAIYGFSLGYRWSGDQAFRQVAGRAADFFLGRLPEDGICYWDLAFDEGDGQEKDSSAAAIAAAGMLELSDHLRPPGRDRYRRSARRIIRVLSADYSTTGSNADGLLLHGVYDRPRGQGVSECCIWGDYFYAEAVLRLASGEVGFW